jgi:hypothetical protein
LHRLPTKCRLSHRRPDLIASERTAQGNQTGASAIGVNAITRRAPAWGLLGFIQRSWCTAARQAPGMRPVAGSAVPSRSDVNPLKHNSYAAEVRCAGRHAESAL